MNTEEILNLIQNGKKQTFSKVYIQGDLTGIDFGQNLVIQFGHGGIIFGDWDDIRPLIEKHPRIEKIHIENDRRNSSIKLLDLKELDARVEPGAIVREGVTIEKNVVVMMGACVNIGARIGEGTLIDMNAVIGGRANIGKRCHIGAGVVIKGVISSPHAAPVEIGDEVIIGPNAVVMEGIKIEKGAVIPAGVIVSRNVEAGEIYSG